jgi:hypothetical protein
MICSSTSGGSADAAPTPVTTARSPSSRKRCWYDIDGSS